VKESETIRIYTIETNVQHTQLVVLRVCSGRFFICYLSWTNFLVNILESYRILNGRLKYTKVSLSAQSESLTISLGMFSNGCKTRCAHSLKMNNTMWFCSIYFFSLKGSWSFKLYIISGRKAKWIFSGVDRGSMHAVEHLNNIFLWKKICTFTGICTVHMCRGNESNNRIRKRGKGGQGLAWGTHTSFLLKGTVPRVFLIHFSFHQSTPPWSLISRC
jgi:hypothetical protein